MIKYKRTRTSVPLLPTQGTANLIGKIHPLLQRHRKKIEISLGICLMLIGSTIATYTEIPYMGHVGTDTLAWGLHGFGAAPIIKASAEILGMDV